MALESVTHLSDLVATNPVSASDNPRYIADHVRNMKSALLTDFPNINGVVSASDEELSFVDGVTSAIQTQLDNLASITQNADPAAAGTTYTLVLADANKHLYKNGTDAETWTIPPNSSVAFPLGTPITFVNDAAGAITVARGSGVALIWAGDGTDANRTLAQYGLVTIVKVGTNRWYISGVGLS